MNSLKLKNLIAFSILLSSIFFLDHLNAQTTCATAVTVTANGSCIGATTVNDATIDGNATVCGGTVSREIWYKFTCIGNSATIVATAGDRNVAIELLSACGGTVLDCDNTTTAGGADTETLTVTGLTNGTTYIVRIVNVGNNNLSLTSLCITTTTTFDPCASISNIAACGSTVNATIASGNGAYGTSDCGFTTGGKELIYTFTPATSGNYSIQQLSSFAYIDYQFKAVSAGCNGTGYTCIDDITGAGTSPAFSLTGGTQYYILLDPESTAGGNVSFVVTCAAPAPANDNPCSATPVTVNSAFTCTTQTGGTIAGATASGNALGACFGTADDDVWFSFVANNSTQNISLNNITGSTSDLYFSVYSGACGSPGTALLCSDPESNTLTGLTVGNTYIIRVYSYTSTSGQTSSFSVCITPPPVAPANDNPCNATAVPVNAAAGTCTTQTAGTIAGATASGNALGACGGTADDDVWFSFVANSTSMNINLNNVTGSTTDLYHSVYSGSCGSLGTALVCSDPNSSSITGLTIGNTYIIRIYSYTSTSGQTTSFSVCINPTPPPPTNVTCPQMQPICSGSPIVFQAQASGGSAATGPNYGCLSTTPNPTWFYLQISTPGTMAIDLTAGSDVDFALWGPYASLATAQANCTSYPTPLDCSYSSSATEQMNISSVTTGQVYVVLVTNYASVVQSITLNQATGATATTNCSILPIELVSFKGKNNGTQNALEWITASEKNNDYFTIEKSGDAVNFEQLAVIDGAGNSTSTLSYSTYDDKPFEITYYRLKQTNYDNTFHYSETISIDRAKGEEKISNVYPNPTKENINFDVFTKTKGNLLVEVINNKGEQVYKANQLVDEGGTSLNISMSDYRNGVYLLKVTIEQTGKVLLYKIIKD